MDLLWTTESDSDRSGTGTSPVRHLCVFRVFQVKLLCVTLNSADDFCVEAAVIKHVDKSNKRTKTISLRVQLRHRSVKRGLTIYFVVEICCF